MTNTLPVVEKSLEVEGFLLRFPEQLRPVYRRLLYYAAMPLVLTPELLHYLRNAFVREAPWVAEADLLLADNLFEEKNFEQYVMATPVRTLLLREAAEQLGERNMQEAARLLVSYLYRHLPFSSLSPSEVTAQRWAALLYLDDYHDKVVAEIVQALHEALSASDAVSGYEGRAAFESMLEVINQIAPTLADQPELVDLARLTQSLLHEEIDPTLISQERLMQSPVVAGIQLPAIGRILRTMGAAPTVERGPAVVPREAGETGAGERRFQLRATLPGRLVVGVPAVLRVEVSSPEDAEAILLENGDALLLESGDALLLEDDIALGGITPLGESEIEAGGSLALEEAENELRRAVNFILPLKPLAEDVLEASVGATAVLAIRVTAPDFEIADDEQSLRVGADPGPTRVMFTLTPMQTGNASLLIECYADNLVVAAIRLTGNVITKDGEAAFRHTSRTTVLYLASNPVDTEGLQLLEEERLIREALQRSEFRDRFDLQVLSPLTIDGLASTLRSLEATPVIIHVAGYIHGDEVLLEGDDGLAVFLSVDSLKEMLVRMQDVRCVVLNTGESGRLANSLAEVVPCAIGMESSLIDDAAIQFAVAFYGGIGDGLSYRQAFELAANALKLVDDSSKARPIFVEGGAAPIREAGPVFSPPDIYGKWPTFSIPDGDGRQRTDTAFLQEHSFSIDPFASIFDTDQVEKTTAHLHWVRFSADWLDRLSAQSSVIIADSFADGVAWAANIPGQFVNNSFVLAGIARAFRSELSNVESLLVDLCQIAAEHWLKLIAINSNALLAQSADNIDMLFDFFMWHCVDVEILMRRLGVYAVSPTMDSVERRRKVLVETYIRQCKAQRHRIADPTSVQYTEWLSIRPPGIDEETDVTVILALIFPSLSVPQVNDVNLLAHQLRDKRVYFHLVGDRPTMEHFRSVRTTTLSWTNNEIQAMIDARIASASAPNGPQTFADLTDYLSLGDINPYTYLWDAAQGSLHRALRYCRVAVEIHQNSGAPGGFTEETLRSARGAVNRDEA